MMERLIPEQVIKLLAILNDNGYEGYIVGGAVRDYLLGITPKDYDIATNASVTEMLSLFASFKVIETGLKHGTITIRVNHMSIEITTYRDQYKTLKGDLLLRDFTINSIAYSPLCGLVDYCHGIDDIKNKIICINGNDDSRFKEDPLRILRAIRLSAVLNFEISDQTIDYIFNDSNLINEVSVERINDEFTKILLSSKPSIYIRKYFNVFAKFIPEIIPLKDFNQNNPHHIYDCLEHTLIVIDNVKPDLVMRLSALFHDSGKPFTYTEDDHHIGHFYNHYKVSINIAKKVLKRLRYDHRTINQVLNLIRFHDYPLTITRKSIKKLLNYFGTSNIDDLLDLKRADTLGQSPDNVYRLKEIEQARAMIKDIINEGICLSLKDLEINGKDLIDIGINDGPEIGNILKQLLNLVIREELVNDRFSLLKKAKELKKDDY